MINWKEIMKQLPAGTSQAAVMAVAEVESAGYGFLSNSKPKILFERHVFWRRLVKIGINPKTYNQPDILSKKAGGYLGNLKEYQRLDDAIKISRVAALESCSWGAFQIMGYHWKTLGYSTIDEFIKSMKSEHGQAMAFVRFIKHNKLSRFLTSSPDFAAFARRYNGPAYKKNAYDVKMRSAFNRFINEIENEAIEHNQPIPQEVLNQQSERTPISRNPFMLTVDGMMETLNKLQRV